MKPIRTHAYPLLASLMFSGAAFAVDLQDGAVYVMTNQPTNEVVIFDRLANGSLSRVGQVATGGEGNPFKSGTTTISADPLASQGALGFAEGIRCGFGRILSVQGRPRRAGPGGGDRSRTTRWIREGCRSDRRRRRAGDRHGVHRAPAFQALMARSGVRIPACGIRHCPIRD